MKRMIVGISLLLVPLQAANSQDLAAESVIGCYRVEFDLWPENADHLVGPANFAKQIELTTEDADFFAGEHFYKLRILAPAESEDYTPLTWRPRGAQVGIEYVLPFAGMHLRLRVAQESLIGVATAFTDYIEEGLLEEAQGPVVLYRTKCPVRE